jgi:hypothetical protein
VNFVTPRLTRNPFNQMAGARRRQDTGFDGYNIRIPFIRFTRLPIYSLELNKP